MATDFTSALIGAGVTAALFVLRDISKGYQDRRTLSHQTKLEGSGRKLTPPKPSGDDASLTQDQWDRIHARLIGLRAPLQARSILLWKYVDDFHAILGATKELGFQVDEFYVPQSDQAIHNFNDEGPQPYIDGKRLFSRLEAFIAYVEKKRPD